MSPRFTNLTFLPDAEPSTASFVHTLSLASIMPVSRDTTVATEPQRPSDSRPKPPATQQITSSHFCHASGRKSALLVHDDAQVGRALALILGRDCIHLMAAGSVAEAMKMLTVFGDEIGVMLAVLGPTGQAMDLLAAHRHVGRKTPMIVFKSGCDHTGRAAAVQAGAVTFVDYPVDPTELRFVIMRVC